MMTLHVVWKGDTNSHCFIITAVNTVVSNHVEADRGSLGISM